MLSKDSDTITSAIKLGTLNARLMASAPTNTLATNIAAAGTPSGCNWANMATITPV